VTDVSAKRIAKRRKAEVPLHGRADLARLRRQTEREIAATSPAELAELPEDFWEEAELVLPVEKQAISLRVDRDVLAWFKAQGPRYQSRMNAVLRSYMRELRGRRPPATRRRSGAA
jgi:uncharacterized protein (DUF4415 family)